MAETVKLPGLGQVKKPYVYAGVGITAGILAWAYWRRSNAAPAADTTPVADTTSTATGDYTQGSDAAGYNTVYPSVYSGLDFNQGGTTDTTGNGYSTNAEWTSAAEGALSDQGVDTATAAAAISKILAGLPVTSAQKDLFLQAKGLLGDPPGGYPPIHTSDNGDGTPPPSTPSTPLPGPKGIHAYAVGKTSTGVAWFNVPVAGVKGYHVYMRGRSGAVASTAAGDTTTVVHGLHHGTNYYFHVRAYDASGRDGYSSGELHVKTHK